MRRLATGDRAALRDVYEATHRKLFGICLRILQDRKEAEDAVQDVYVTLWRRADRFDPERASPISWLAVLARNGAIDRLRRLQRLGEAAPVELAAELPDPEPLAVDLLIDAERVERVHACLGGLEEKQGDAIRRAFLEGQSYATLAARQKVPLGTMKSRVRRGLARLKECLEREQ
jgi:RNA polymerase sigma factor (sigma-70 family)